MSLYSSIRLANNTLRADQVAMQVIGQNIANANTPGYIREEVVLTPGPTQRLGRLLLGTGVQVEAVIQKLDAFLEERLRGALSDRSSSETQEQTYVQLEGMIGELSDTDLSTSLNSFFGSISDILSDPGSLSPRTLAVAYGTTLAGDMNRLATRIDQMRSDLDERVQGMALSINELTEEISTLNLRISQTEAGDMSTSHAVGLRDLRLKALEDLAKLIDIRATEQPSGGITVYSGGVFLVNEGTMRPVKVVMNTDRGAAVAEIRLAETDYPVEATTGQLRGLITSRDSILGGFLDQLDAFAATLAFEFNKVFSSGQGLNGFQEVTSEAVVDAGDAALNAAGLAFEPVNGSFQIMVHNKRTKTSQTTDVMVDLNGLGKDTTLEDLAAALDAIDGVAAEVTATRKLHVASESPDQELAFAADTSGILAALGINTFFTGSTARGLGVNQVLKDDPAKFAASRDGIGADTLTAIELEELLDRPVSSQNGASLWMLYDRLVGETTQGSTVTQAVAEGNRVFEQTLRGQKMATSGVSLDEEAIRLIAHQHSFQASARYIGALRDLLDILVAL